MKFLAAILAVLFVTAALAAIALWLLRKAQAQDRPGWRWLLAFLGTWLGGLTLGACGARFISEQHYHTPPELWVVSLSAVALAFAVSGLLVWILGRAPRPKTEAPPPPAPEPSPTVISEPSIFKFACPHCGQRLAVSTEQVGTTENCPNCAAPLTVPAPETPRAG
jgi:hypothetical protein